MSIHYLVWVIPRQLFDLGDTWRYSTCAIESRARPFTAHVTAQLRLNVLVLVSWQVELASSALLGAW